MAERAETVRRQTLAQQVGMMARRADHAMGLELQIVELVERQTRARVQHRHDDADRIEVELTELRAELAATCDYNAPWSPRSVRSGVETRRRRLTV